MSNIMPVIFTGHGSPMNAIGENRARNGWKKMGEELGKPKAILAVSAHWATSGRFIRTAADNPQINDMYGFPKELYAVHYEPAGVPEIAKRVIELTDGMAWPKNDWGIDHGMWSVLSNMYPDADVPMVCVSTDIAADAQAQAEFGRLLRPLREEGVMIVASGNVVHHLGLVNWEMDDGYPWADAFDESIRDAIVSGRRDIPVNYEQVPEHRKAVPSVEHYYPLLTALGASDEADHVHVWNEYRELGSMSMTSYTFSR